VPRFSLVSLALLLTIPAIAAPRRHSVDHATAVTTESIVTLATRAADRVQLSFDPRLHWENAVWLDGLVLFGEELNRRNAGSGDRFIDRAASIILDSNDDIAHVYWGDGTAFVQAAMDLYRVLPAGDPRREAILATATGPLSFAEHAIRGTPANAPPRDPWWIAGGYGTRYWQDDLHMVVPWLAMLGASANNELARSLAHEWIEAYISRLWDDTNALFQHHPEIAGTSDLFWGRGNGWALVGLLRAAEVLDANDLRDMLRRSAASLIARRSPDGAWGSFLAQPNECNVSETSATALLIFFLARGINNGLLDRAIYEPIVMRAFGVLLQRVRADGTVAGIQPPGIGPACVQIASDDPAINVNYGAGAILLAAAEVLKFPDATFVSK